MVETGRPGCVAGVGRVVALCAAAAFADGYDVQALGLAIPHMAIEFGVSPTKFAAAASTSLIGMAIGAMLLSPLADRYGRERTMAVMLASIGLATAGASVAGSALALAAWRFLSGLGLGAVVPVAIALTSAKAPAGKRAFLVTLVVAVTGVGAFSAGLLAPVIAQAAGWRSLFYAGAAMPLVAAALAWSLLVPIARDTATRRAPGTGPAVDELFAPALRRLTLLVWGIFWLNLMVNYSLISWLPTLLVDAKWDIGSASRASGLVAIGGIVGSLAISALADRGRPIPTLIGAYLAAALAFALFAIVPAAKGPWIALILIAGLTAFGAQIAVSAIIAVRYPLAIRTTAIGWSSGIGRIGAFVGPLIVAGLMAAGTRSATLIALLAIPMLVCAACALAIPRGVASDTI